MPKDFISAIRGGISGVMGDRYVHNGETMVKPVPGWTKSHSQSQSQSHNRKQIR